MRSAQSEERLKIVAIDKADSREPLEIGEVPKVPTSTYSSLVDSRRVTGIIVALALYNNQLKSDYKCEISIWKGKMNPEMWT